VGLVVASFAVSSSCPCSYRLASTARVNLRKLVENESCLSSYDFNVKQLHYLQYHY